MALNPGNYGLSLNRQNTNWLNNNYSSSPMLSSAPQQSGINWGSIGSGILSNINPIAAGGSMILGGIGSYLQAKEENKRYDKEFEYRKKQDRQQQENYNRQMGMNTVNLMKDDFKTALYRSLRGGY